MASEKIAIGSHVGSPVDSASYSWRHDISHGLIYCISLIQEKTKNKKGLTDTDSDLHHTYNFNELDRKDKRG